jgi:hypothetical protein
MNKKIHSRADYIIGNYPQASQSCQAFFLVLPASLMPKNPFFNQKNVFSPI